MAHILHVTEACHAGSIGGTERYILDLINGLDAAGIQNTIGWVKPTEATETLTSEGVRIMTLPSPPKRLDLPVPEFRRAAEHLLDTVKPDLLHFHTLGLTEALLARLGKERGIPYAYVYHSPAETCRRVTLLHHGTEPCDGEVRAWRCSACKMEERAGRGPLAGGAAAAFLVAVGWAVPPTADTMLRRGLTLFYDLVRFRPVLRRFLAECDLVVSCCEWSGPVLRRNGARDDRMVHCPQGVSNALAATLASELKKASGSATSNFVVGYVGRVTEEKGVHILMEGFTRMKANEARLRIIGWHTHLADMSYYRQLQKIAQADSRIELVPSKSFAEMPDEYRRLSLLAIPSVWFETGPLTLLEAIALGVPVYGSNRLGQLHLLREHGRIVEPNTPAGWEDALSSAFAAWKQAARNAERTAVPLRTMANVAAEMATSYRAVLAN